MQDQLFQMTHLRPEETRLPMVIWLSVNKHANHRCEIKVQTEHGEKATPSNWISVSVDDDPTLIGETSLSAKDLMDLKKFIFNNHQTIVKYWNDEISTTEMVDSIVKIII